MGVPEGGLAETCGCAVSVSPCLRRRAATEAIASARKSQVGTGDRSERIRTYNYPQGRVTDHRIGLTLYSLESFLSGDLDEMIDALITADTAEKLKGAEDD